MIEAVVPIGTLKSKKVVKQRKEIDLFEIYEKKGAKDEGIKEESVIQGDRPIWKNKSRSFGKLLFKSAGRLYMHPFMQQTLNILFC